MRGRSDGAVQCLGFAELTVLGTTELVSTCSLTSRALHAMAGPTHLCIDTNTRSQYDSPTVLGVSLLAGGATNSRLGVFENMKRSDSELVQKARDGDSTAWADLIDKYEGLVWHVIRGFRLSYDDATDVAQMTWLRAVERLDSVREPERIGLWLSTIARREALNLVNKSQRMVPIDVEEFPRQFIADPAGADESALDRVVIEQILAAFSELGDSCRQLVRLLLAEPQQSYADIAETLGIAVGTIGPRRRRCFEQLRVAANQ